MKEYKNVRSTAEYVPSIEVSVDTVYVRNNIRKVDEEDFSGWEYNEVQYDKDSYIEQINDLGQQVAEREIENLILGQQVADLELMILTGRYAK